MHGKENDGVGVAASLVGNVGSSYVARLQRRQELDKLRESVAGKSVSDRLMRKSLALRPAKGNSATSHQHHQGSLLSTAPQSPLTSLAASEALLDDAAEKLQRELESYDQKLQALRSHAGSLPAIPLPPNGAAAFKASIAAATAKPDRQASVLPVAPPQAAPASSEQPIVRSVITATGQGCKEVLAASAKAASMGTRRKTGSAASAAATWKTRAHKAPRTQSSCMLQLAAKKYRDVAIRITFADAITVPALLCFEHAPTPTAPFVLLGQVPLQPKSTKQLKHVFRLGADTTVEKCLRITCLGHIAKKHSGVHNVSHLLITGEVAPPSPPPVAPVASVTSSGSTVKQVLVGNEPEEEIESASSAPVEAVAFHNVSLDAGKPLAPNKDGNDFKVDGCEKSVKEIKIKAAPPPAPPLPPQPLAPSMISVKGAAPAPPPPPPPASGVSRLPPGKVGPAPSRPTLKLFWDKVQPRESIIQKTVWGQLPESSENNLEIDFTRLEEEFAAKAPAIDFNNLGNNSSNASGAGAPGARTRALRSAGPVLVPIHRANNVGAMLARLKLTPEEAKRALLRLVGDDEEEIKDQLVVSEENNSNKSNTATTNSISGRVLGLEELESILPCMPTDEERQILAKYEGNMEGLTPCERFMLSVLPVPALQARLQAIVFLHGFDSRAAAVGEAASSVTTACTEVRESSLLRSILKTALAIGNFLNAGNRAGSAAAFQVDALLKLKDIKSTTSRSKTLLHFVAREVFKQHPECSSLASELPTCRVASRISLGDLRAELDALAEGIEAAHRAGREGGAELMHLDELLAVATERLAGVNGTLVEADAAFMELRSFLNSKPSTMEEPAAFFSLLATFCNQLDVAHAENAVVDATARPSSAPTAGSSNPRSDPQLPQQGSVRHSMGSSFVPGGTADAIPREESTTTATLPVQRRDDVLSTIRAYSRLSAEQRKTLLTDKGAKERIASLGITHRHSIAAPTGLADVFKNNSNVGGALGAIQEQEEELMHHATAMRISAPAISLAALLAAATTNTAAITEEREVEQAVTELLEDSLHTEVQLHEEEFEGEEEHTEIVNSKSPSETASEIEEDESRNGDATTAPAALSSPVARMLSSSRNLVESVALRCSTMSMQQEKKQEDEKKQENPLPQQATAAAPVVPALSTRSDDAHSDVSIDEAGLDNVDDNSQLMDSSPVTLRPVLNASVDDFSSSPQATPHVVWAKNKKSARSGGNVSQGLKEEHSSDSIGNSTATPDGAVLPCSASLQPVPAGDAGINADSRVWRSSVAALEVEQEEEQHSNGGGGAAAAASSFACLSHENPMASAPTSLNFGYRGNGGAAAAAAATAYQYDHALEDDAGSPEKPTRPRSAPATNGSIQEEEEKELCCSTQWVQHAAGASAAGAGAAAAAAGVRGSKRVSFSLPNSPRGSSSANVEDANEGDLVTDSPCVPHSPVAEQHPQQSQQQQPPEQQQQQSQLSHGSVGTSKQTQRVSIPGLNLDLAKQLVKNASQVKKSRERRGSYSQQGMQPVSETTPSHFVDSGGALSPTYTPINSSVLNATWCRPSPGGSSVAPPPPCSIQEQAAQVLSKALAAEMRRSLPGLPGVPSDTLPAFPYTLSPVNMDQIMAAIISNAGNTPTGPLARGVRQGDAHLFDDAAIEVLRAAAAERLAIAEHANPGQEHKALLEPIVPAPLGMGVRVSETVAHGISPSTLRHSLEAHLRQLQQTSSQSQQHYQAISRAHTTAANTANGAGGGLNRPLNVSIATAAQGATPAPSYRQEEEQYSDQQQQQQEYHQQQQEGVSCNSDGYGYGSSYAASGDKSRMTASGGGGAGGGGGGDYNYSGNFEAVGAREMYNEGGASASQVSNMRLSGMRQSVPKSGSVRDVHSSLAQERIARWNGGSSAGY